MSERKWCPENVSEENGAALVEAINFTITNGGFPENGEFILRSYANDKIVAIATMTDAAHQRMLRIRRDAMVSRKCIRSH